MRDSFFARNSAFMNARATRPFPSSNGWTSPLRLHDLRHSVASFAGAHGYSLFLIGKLLGHKTARSTERYAHITDDARKVMADNVGEGIRAALDSQPSVRRAASTMRVRQ